MRTTHPSRSRLLGGLVACGLLVAACGGGSSDSSDPNDTSDGGDSESGYAASMPECPVDALASAAGPVDIVVWNTASGKTKESVDALVAEYNASQDKVVVTAETVGGDYSEIWNKYQSGAQAGDLPNIAVLEDLQFQAVGESGTVLPAQACIDAEGYDTSDLVQTAVDSYSIDGALVPGSAQLSGPVLYYNKNHFRAAGLDPETPPGTLAEVREYAQKIKDAGVSSAPLVLYTHPWFVETWLTGAGQPVVNNDNGRGHDETSESTLVSEDTTAAYDWVLGMKTDGLANTIPYNPGTIDHYLAVANQEGSMLIETSSAATSIKAFLGGDTDVVEGSEAAGGADLSKLDIGVGPMPGLEEPGQVQVGGGIWVMALTGTPEQQSASWDFMKWWNTPATQAKWNMDGGYLPFNQLALDDPALQAYWQDDLAGQWLSLAYDQMVDGIDPNFPGPAMGPFDIQRDAMSKSLDDMLLNGVAPEAAISQAAATVTEALQRYLDEGF